MRLKDFTPQASGQLGVTFIELLISIAVLAVLVALAAPYFGNYIERQRLVGATEALHGQIQQAKRAAISNNKTIYLQVSNGANWASVYGDTNPPAGEVNGLPVLDVDSEDYPTTEVATSVTIAFEKPGLNTNVSGSLAVGSPSGWKVIVSLSPIGRVEICSDDVSQYPDCP
ncbi:GspH/FimT family pseudopilin [Marinobacterium mangrovicola]|uniref:Type II secretion system protein H n=1 Tax=Marinobacterium mangrovicola TaxID=1476959 RepID=A0A4R1GD02_9GAMM|nr:GspH/FimT family pseudopilin [Marinobacterium mangrovicola]TCK05944.1 type IV fimbrial biogenesis protein FimT [Marinobacterium mangrovicola]